MNYNLNIFEQANLLLTNVRKSIKNFNETVGKSMQNYDGCPLIFDDSNELINEQLDQVTDGVWIERDKFFAFFDSLIESGKTVAMYTIATTEDISDIIKCSIDNGVRKINDVPVIVDEVTTEVGSYVCVLHSIVLTRSDLTKFTFSFEEFMSSLIEADEINRVNCLFLEAISLGQDTLDNVLNRANLMFIEAKQGTKEYIKQIADALSSGVTGYISLIRTMYQKLVDFSTLSTDHISFTDNNQYIMKNFTSGVLSLIDDVVSSAWNSAIGIFTFILNITNRILYEGYHICEKLVNKLLDNFTTSSINFKSNNSLFPVGILQCRISESDWTYTESHHEVTFPEFRSYLLSKGPIKFFVPWGFIYVWVNTDEPYVYIESKLRTDVRNFWVPLSIGCCNDELDLSTFNLVPWTGNNPIGHVYLKHASGQYNTNVLGNAIVDVSFSYPHKRADELYDFIDNYVDVSPIDQFKNYSELDLSARIENAYMIFLFCVVAYECRVTSSTITMAYSISPSSKYFEYIRAQYPQAYVIIGALYTIAYYKCYRAPASNNLIAKYNGVSADNCWNMLIGSHAYLDSYSSSEGGKYVFGYFPVNTINCSTFLNLKLPHWFGEVINDARSAAVINELNEGEEFNLNDGPVIGMTSNANLLPLIVIGSVIDNLGCSNVDSVIHFLSTTPCINMDYVGENGVFITPPSYTKGDILAGVLLIIGVVLGISTIIAVPTMIIKHRMRARNALRIAKCEKAWNDATDDPSIDNIRYYQKLVRQNNRYSRVFGGQMLSKSSYWGENDNTSLVQSVSNQLLSKGASVINKTPDLEDIYRALTGKTSSN